MTSIELLKIISQPWASVKDIQKIASCGRDCATDIRNKISKIIRDNGQVLPDTKEKIVPMTYVINYLGLDVNHIAFMAVSYTHLTLPTIGG